MLYKSLLIAVLVGIVLILYSIVIWAKEDIESEQLAKRKEERKITRPKGVTKLSINQMFNKYKKGENSDDYMSIDDMKEAIILTYDKVKEENQKLVLDFDGGQGYPVSFIAEVFDNIMGNEADNKAFLGDVPLISLDEPSLVNSVVKAILNEG